MAISGRAKGYWRDKRQVRQNIPDAHENPKNRVCRRLRFFASIQCFGSGTLAIEQRCPGHPCTSSQEALRRLCVCCRVHCRSCRPDCWCSYVARVCSLHLAGWFVLFVGEKVLSAATCRVPGLVMYRIVMASNASSYWLVRKRARSEPVIDGGQITSGSCSLGSSFPPF